MAWFGFLKYTKTMLKGGQFNPGIQQRNSESLLSSSFDTVAVLMVMNE